MKAISMYVNGHTLQNRNPGTGGGGIVLSYGGATKELSVSGGMTTNNKAELTAAITGFEALTQPCVVTVYSCSQWFINCASGEWDRGNHLDLWNKLAELTTKHTVTFQWIKKGSHELLTRASMLANEAANESAMELKKTS